ncbi:hypothetical protein L1887_59704 [Cichorium endivia]|nr:hypothetical protein L1887_59704 [Cichorium endivia]
MDVLTGASGAADKFACRRSKRRQASEILSPSQSFALEPFAINNGRSHVHLTGLELNHPLGAKRKTWRGSSGSVSSDRSACWALKAERSISSQLAIFAARPDSPNSPDSPDSTRTMPLFRRAARGRQSTMMQVGMRAHAQFFSPSLCGPAEM